MPFHSMLNITTNSKLKESERMLKKIFYHEENPEDSIKRNKKYLNSTSDSFKIKEI